MPTPAPDPSALWKDVPTTRAAGCASTWPAMSGDERVRVCQVCGNRVFNPSAASPGETRALIEAVCGRVPACLFRRRDGTVMAADCPIGLRRRRLGRVGKATLACAMVLAAVLSTASIRAGCAHQDVASPSQPPPSSEVAGHAQPVAAPPPAPPDEPRAPSLLPAEGGDRPVVTAARDAGIAPAMGSASLERTECYGYCPAYRVTIAADGTVAYVGNNYVRVHGKKARHVDPEKARALLEHFASAQFLAMNARYSIGITDNPTAKVTLTVGGRTKTVEDYPPCHKANYGAATPGELCALEQEIDDLAGSAEWVECHNDADRPYCDTP